MEARSARRLHIPAIKFPSSEVTMLRELFALLTALLIASKILRSYRRNAHLPPGPKGLPLLGNLLDMPKKEVHVTFRDWARIYGKDLMRVQVPGETFYVISNKKVMVDLFEGRSATYSDKPRMTMAESTGFKNVTPLLPYNARLKTSRRFLKQCLSPAAVRSYHPYINNRAALLLEALHTDPDDYVRHYTRMAAHTALKITYGYEGVTEDRHLLEGAIETMEIFAKVVAPGGGWMVDALPILDRLPAWFPFAGFKRYQELAKPVVLETVCRPFEEVKKHLAQGTADGSFCSYLLQTEKIIPEVEDCIRWAASSIFLGQFDTTTATLSWFTHAMLTHPEVQQKAQAELDRVVGPDRLPGVEDRDSLPYVNAILKEIFRWQPILSMLPRTSNQDDEYTGYFIPKGTYMLANIWAVLHDPEVYPNPETFMPERHLESSTPDPLEVAFGFGRRVCPGMLVAQAQAFATMACVLAVFDLKAPKDEFGNEVVPVTKSVDSLINFPVPFKCMFIPRSDAALEIIQRSAEHARFIPDRLERWSD
ncbi:cytochrome P450 [Phanerochaete sordida]|uniref:Cytochrome P450 n=1 Tax=Phanerochaete sordida TaxID=48140 RepID=A0A9P3LDN6_9APHY|nr:cytochrome P450 [Phanerochaete sordida]